MDIIKEPAEVNPTGKNSVEIPSTTPVEVPFQEEIKVTKPDRK